MSSFIKCVFETDNFCINYKIITQMFLLNVKSLNRQETCSCFVLLFILYSVYKDYFFLNHLFLKIISLTELCVVPLKLDGNYRQINPLCQGSFLVSGLNISIC